MNRDARCIARVDDHRMTPPATKFPPGYHGTVFLLEDPPDPLPAAFAIITAWNPMDRPTPTENNRAADGELRRALEQGRIPHFRATGCSPDLGHREPGWACCLPRDQALALARHCQQRAIWWVEHHALVLISCLDGTEESVARFSSRIRQPLAAP